MASLEVLTSPAAALLESLYATGLQLSVPAHSVLFVEGDEAAGVLAIRAGQVKLTLNSSRGRTLILRIAEAGEVLGMHNCISCTPHQVSAETVQRCGVAFVRRDDFLRLLAREPHLISAVAGHLSWQCHSAYNLIQAITTSHCTSERLAQLLLNFAANAEHDTARAAIAMTHEEIAQMIGTSRETVTRLLKEFRTRHLATLKGSTLHILDKAGLERIARPETRPSTPPPIPFSGILPQALARHHLRTRTQH